MELPCVWPRVRSDQVVVFFEAQFPDQRHGRDENDAEELLKLASESCTICLNPYHVSLDCGNADTEIIDAPSERNPQG